MLLSYPAGLALAISGTDFLYRPHDFFPYLWRQCQGDGVAAGDGRLIEDFVHQCFATDGVVVGDGFFAGGGVDDHGDVAVDDMVNDMRAALGDFVDAFAGDVLRASKWAAMQRHAQHCRHFQIERGNPVRIFVGDDFRERA